MAMNPKLDRNGGSNANNCSNNVNHEYINGDCHIHSNSHDYTNSSSQQYPPLLRLPPEVVILIAELLETRDQLSLGRTSRRLHQTVNPVIYAADIRSGRSDCLFWAVHAGCTGVLEQALACGAQLDTRGLGERIAADEPSLRDLRHPLQFRTPLHWAVLARKADVVEWLLDHGADPDAASEGVTATTTTTTTIKTCRTPLVRPLLSALRLGELAIARLLVRRGASNMAELERGRESTALHCAASSGFASVIELLRSAPDFVPDALDASGHTALHLAARIRAAPGDLAVRDTAAALLAVGADVEARSADGATPLVFACREGNFALATELLRAGADPAGGETTDSPLFYCVRRMHHFSRWEAWDPSHDARDEFDRQAAALIGALAAAGLDVDSRAAGGLTPLMAACQEAGPRIIEALLAAGASVTATDDGGRTPLVHVFAIPGMVDTAVIELLVRGGASLSSGSPGSSPLELAIDSSWGRSSRSLESMLAHAGAANVGASQLRAALDKCVADAFPEPVELLLAFQARVFGTPPGALAHLLDQTIRHPDQPTHVQTFGILMRAADAEGARSVGSDELLLLKTVRARNRPLALAVLERGLVSASVRLPDDDTFLHLVCRWGEPAVVAALLSRGADVDALDADLLTPLAVAVVENHAAVAQCLLEGGADPYLAFPRLTSPRLAAPSPFDLAILFDRISIVEGMLRSRPLPSSSGSYVLRASRKPGDTAMLELLLAAGADSVAGCPARALLSRMWSQPHPPDLAASSLGAVKLLAADRDALAGAADLLREITSYAGDDEDRVALSRMVREAVGEKADDSQE